MTDSTDLRKSAPSRIEYQEHTTMWHTPRGRESFLIIREGTSDWNTVNSVMTNDEYGLRDLYLSGLALDVGAHIGVVSIALALDNPALHVTAIEALSENAELARRNAELSDVADRVTVLHAAAAAPGVETAEVDWRGQGNETREHHAFIGNSDLVYRDGQSNHETETVTCVDLGFFAGPTSVSFMKIDCEGCEWGFLASPAVAYVERITGEWHQAGGHVQEDIVALLSETHDVTTSGPVEGPGGFVAVRR